MPRSPIYNALLKATPWEYVPADSVITLLMHTVPPGKAARARQRMFLANAKKKPEYNGLAEDEILQFDCMEPDKRIQTGARDLINQNIGSAVSNGHLTSEIRGATRYIRRVPKPMVRPVDVEDATQIIVTQLDKFQLAGENRAAVAASISEALTKRGFDTTEN